MKTPHEMLIPAGDLSLEGSLELPPGARGLVLFAHGSGSSRFSPRNNYVAQVLREARLGTLLMDLLTRQEDAEYATRFDIHLLARRLISATQWVMELPQARGLALGYFGASTGAAAALEAAAELSATVRAVVSRGGRPDLAMEAVPRVQAATLLLVGGDDELVIDLNRQAFTRIEAQKELIVIAGASHLFEEPGKLEEVARLAVWWFQRYLTAAAGQAQPERA